MKAFKARNESRMEATLQKAVTSTAFLIGETAGAVDGIEKRAEMGGKVSLVDADAHPRYAHLL